MPARLPCRISMSVALLALPLLAGGCSSGIDDNKAGLSCVDDSKECVDRRQATLQSMLADKDKAWVREPASAQAHASGVRLFAFRTRKKELSCEELAAGRREADSAHSLRAGTEGLTPAQVARAKMFAAEVSKELTVEMRSRRCKA